MNFKWMLKNFDENNFSLFVNTCLYGYGYKITADFAV